MFCHVQPFLQGRGMATMRASRMIQLIIFSPDGKLPFHKPFVFRKSLTSYFVALSLRTPRSPRIQVPTCDWIFAILKISCNELPKPTDFDKQSPHQRLSLREPLYSRDASFDSSAWSFHTTIVALSSLGVFPARLCHTLLSLKSCGNASAA